MSEQKQQKNDVRLHDTVKRLVRCQWVGLEHGNSKCNRPATHINHFRANIMEDRDMYYCGEHMLELAKHPEIIKGTWEQISPNINNMQPDGWYSTAPVDSPSAGWVSVNDELPKESGKYRVKIKRGSAKVTTDETETLFFKKPNRSYWGIGGDWDVVTHWKPNAKNEPRGK